MIKTKTARNAALEAISRCRRDGAWSGSAIDAVVTKNGLDRRDCALASRLCLGVLQNSALCDFYISCFCRSNLEPKVRDILRMAVYQLLFLDRIPSSAAVNEAVNLCRENGLGRACGLVNAVLRRISDNIDSLPEIPGKGSAGYLSVKYSHPIWLCEYICRLKGYEFAEAFLRSNNEQPEITLQVNTLKTEPSDYAALLRESGFEFHQVGGLSGSIGIEKGSVTELPGFEEGLYYVQDMAARLSVMISGAEEGMRILDACSCPGGKSFAAAIQMNGTGSILSCDISEKKLRLVDSGAARLGIDIIKTCQMDARAHDDELEEMFDVVIADVPCSGMGVIRKKPEIRDRDEAQLRHLPEIQSAILDNLSGYVKHGGVLLYSTCTVLQEENEQQVAAFLEKHSDFHPEPFTAGKITSENGMYTFWPNVDGTDGFFAAKLRKL